MPLYSAASATIVPTPEKTAAEAPPLAKINAAKIAAVVRLTCCFIEIFLS